MKEMKYNQNVRKKYNQKCSFLNYLFKYLITVAIKKKTQDTVTILNCTKVEKGGI